MSIGFISDHSAAM